ncbi:type IV pilus assembly protein PilE [Oxalobacteraceae bacterium GrIS 2.11]
MKNIAQPRNIEPKSIQSGFTLIELMVVLIILAIIVAVAIPAYTSNVLTSHRSDAKTGLLDLATREEKFFSINNSYGNLSDIYAGTATSVTSLATQSGGTAYYNLSVTPTAPSSSAAASYTASATPQGGQTADTACGTFTITNTGATSVSGTGTNCW